MTDLKTPEARKAGSNAPSDLVGMPYVVYRDDDSISLIDLARLLYAERRIILAIVTFAVLVSAIPPLVGDRIYRAEALLAPVAPNKHEGISALIGQFGELGGLVQRYVGSSADPTAESIAVLQSRALGMAFIEEHGLKPQFFADRWDAARKQWRQGSEPPTDLQAYEVFDKSVREVAIDRRSGLVTLSVEWTDPDATVAWAKGLVKNVNQQRRNEAIQEAQQSIKYLKQELLKTSSVEARQSIYSLIEAQTKAIALANAREEYAFKVIDPPVRPEKPIGRGLIIAVMAGFVIGAVLAGMVVLLRRALKRPLSADPLA